ncbi:MULTISPECIES: type I restriction enzyme endonuclease domain-containing protein [unclassified Saccharopolyspora]|uniref:type I restriction enzyme endonuclease domain-containing protein n=1 Tax=Saccharopolyspora TaxID=1835 RepID=UPI001F26432F|nr:type I restriction enzyme endonuclease domain-containing protein [Saccharopolyspora sp. HNM0986]
MRRDVKTDWTVRDDVRAKLRSSIKQLVVQYPPDKQPESTSPRHRAGGSDAPLLCRHGFARPGRLTQPAGR